ncbi:MAG: hypothetical protein HC915_12835, partial [Anaerolineae bacterium]|nr:hypothetical protein [Anaerolineae bacterium]
MAGRTMYAEVALHRSTPQTFTYAVPFHLWDQVGLGQMVKVPFRTALEAAIVTRVFEEAPEFATKAITEVLDPHPVVTPAQLALAEWLAATYHSSLSNALGLMLPPGITQKSETRYHLLLPDFNADTPTARRLVSLLARRGPLTGQQISQALESTTWKRSLGPLLEAQAVRAEPILMAPRTKPQSVRVVHLNLPAEQIGEVVLHLGRESRRANVLEVLWRQPERACSLAALLDAAGCKKGVINTLQEAEALHLDPTTQRVYLRLTDAETRAMILELRNGFTELAVLQALAGAGGAATLS